MNKKELLKKYDLDIKDCKNVQIKPHHPSGKILSFTWNGIPVNIGIKDK